MAVLARRVGFVALERTVYGVAAAISLVFIWSHRFLPLQDYPDWVYQGALFSDFVSGRLAPEFSWAGAPAPNAISTLVIGLLSLIMPAEVAGKLFLTAYVVGFLAAARALLKAVSADSVLLLLPPVLVWNFSFLHGNVNYAFSLCIFFVSVMLLLRHEERASPFVIALLSLTLYLCHGTTFVAFLVLVAALAIQRRARVLAFALGVSALPAIAYAARKLLTQGPAESSGNGFDLASFAIFKVSTLTKFLAPFAALYPFDQALSGFVPWLVGGNLLFFTGLIWLLRGAPGRIRRDRAWLGWALAFLAILFLIAPRFMAGIVNPGERLILPAVFVLAVFGPPASSARWAMALLPLALALELGFLAIYGGYVSRRLQALHEAVERRAQGGDFGLVHESHFGEQISDAARRLAPGFGLLPRHYPMLRESFLVALERRAVAPIFDTGLFSYRGPDTLFTSFEELGHRNLPPVLVLTGNDGGNALIAHELAARYRTVERGTGFLILEVASTSHREP